MSLSSFPSYKMELNYVYWNFNLTYGLWTIFQWRKWGPIYSLQVRCFIPSCWNNLGGWPWLAIRGCLLGLESSYQVFREVQLCVNMCPYVDDSSKLVMNSRRRNVRLPCSRGPSMRSSYASGCASGCSLSWLDAVAMQMHCAESVQ